MNWKYPQRFRSALAPLAGCLVWAAPLHAARLEWNGNPETNVVGYRVYMGPSSRTYNSVSDAGNTTRFPIDSLAAYQTYFLAVTAYDTEGMESDFSDEVSYTMPGPNRPPVSSGETFVIAQNQVLNKNSASGVLANDSDPDQDVLTAILGSLPANGSVTLDAAGGFLYTPATGFVGQDSFTYRASDGAALSAVTTVAIVVTNTVVVPENQPPVSMNDQYVTGKNGLVSTDGGGGIFANDFDPDDDALTPIFVSAPAHGELTVDGSGGFVYLPAMNYAGNDFFTYCAFDGAATSAVATVTITITNIVPLNRAPIANAEQYTIGKNQILSVATVSGLLANDFDPDGNTITAVIAVDPAHGHLSLSAAGAFTYVPLTDFTGTDSFGYRAFDGVATSAVATVTIVVTNITPIATNRPPVANAEQYAIEKNNMLAVNAVIGVLANDYDADGDAITAAIVSASAHGQLALESSGAFVYLPATNFVGTDSFTYRALDGADVSPIVTVNIVVSKGVPAPNRAPVAVGEQYATGNNILLNVEATRGILANDFDPDGDVIAPTLLMSPAHGLLTVYSTGGFLYTPNANFVGADSFTYYLSDGLLESFEATVFIVVSNTATSANRPPVAVGEDYAIENGKTLVVGAIQGVLANDHDEDGNPISATIVSAPSFGAFTVDADGGFKYTPDGEFVGVDSFTYRASDGLAVSAAVTVVITVTAPVPVSEVTCADCLVELNKFVSSQAARVPASTVQVTSSNSLSEVVRAFTRVVKAARSDDAGATAHLLSVGHCLLTVLSNEVTIRGELVAKMYPSQWSAAAAKLVAALERTSHDAGSAKDASRVIASAVKSLNRLDTFITRSQVVPESLEDRSLAFALTRSPRFLVSFHDGVFSAQDGEGAVLVGTYSFAQTARDQGTLNLNFVSAPPATYNLQFRMPRGRVRGPVAKGAFTFVR